MQRVLLVDDDHVQVDVVAFLLRRAGLETTAAFDAATARRLFAEQQPDLVILDVHLGDADGHDLLRQFRKERPEVSILMLTMLSAEEDRIRGLELGADDYLCKPFGHRELVARVRALLRRRTFKATALPAPSGRMQVGSVVLDPATHEVTSAGRRVELTPTEFRLLQTLMSRPDVVVPMRTLLKEVWNHSDLTARNVVRVTASRLRTKLQNDPLDARLLQTVPGEGLMIRGNKPPPAASSLGPNVAPLDLVVIADLQDLLKEPGAGPTLRQLHDAYANNAANSMRAMRIARANGDTGALADEAHRLRGSSATLGAQRVAKTCALIEQQSRAGDVANVDDLLDDVDEEVSVFRAAIAPMLEPRLNANRELTHE